MTDVTVTTTQNDEEARTATEPRKEASQAPETKEASVLPEWAEEYLLKAFTACKYLWSTFVTLGSVVIILYGISKHYSVLPAPVA